MNEWMNEWIFLDFKNTHFILLLCCYRLLSSSYFNITYPITYTILSVTFSPLWNHWPGLKSGFTHCMMGNFVPTIGSAIEVVCLQTSSSRQPHLCLSCCNDNKSTNRSHREEWCYLFEINWYDNCSHEGSTILAYGPTREFRSRNIHLQQGCY